MRFEYSCVPVYWTPHRVPAARKSTRPALPRYLGILRDLAHTQCLHRDARSGARRIATKKPNKRTLAFYIKGTDEWIAPTTSTSTSTSTCITTILMLTEQESALCF